MDKSDQIWALVTGGYSGIGLELGKLLARDGYSIVLVARNEKRLIEAAAQLEALGAPATSVIVADLAEPRGAYQVVEQLNSDGIGVDVLINNAGFDVYGMFSETDLSLEEDMIDLNVIALTQLTKLLLRPMLERGRGRILVLGSVGSFIPGPLNAVYCATKAYVLSFSEALANELSGSGVTITALCPGATKSEFHQRAEMDRIRILHYSWYSAEGVAVAGYKALMRGQRLELCGAFNKMTIFFGNLLPRRARTALARYMMSSPAD